MLGRRNYMDTASVEAKAAIARKFFTAEKHLKERIVRLHERLMEAKTDFNLSPDHIERAVSAALELAEKPCLKPISLHGAPAGTVFDVSILPGSWGKTTIGLEHPHTGKRRPITFDHEVAKDRDDVVLAHLNHPLVQRCLRLLREEIWRLDDIKRLHRIVVRIIPDGEINNPVVLVWSRLLITGSDHHRLHEELTLSGGELRYNGFNRITQVGKIDSMINTGKPIEPSQALFGLLKEKFEQQEKAVMAAVEARSRDRLKFLESSLERRKKSEIADIQTVLDELESSIQKELNHDKEDGQLFLPGFSPEEMAQVKKDYQALEARLSRIPDEREKEEASIEKHYANPEDRTFPVAIIFLVPQSIAEKFRKS